MTTCTYSNLKRGLPRWFRHDVVPRGREVAAFLSATTAALFVCAAVIEVLYLIGKAVVQATRPYVAVVSPDSLFASRVSESDFQTLSWLFYENRTGDVAMVVIGYGLPVAAIAVIVVVTLHRICQLGAEGTE